MQSNLFGRCAILLILATSIILAFWQFTSLYYHLQLSGNADLDSAWTTKYSFHRSKAINNRLTKTSRVDRWSNRKSRMGVCTLAEHHKPATHTTFLQSEYPAFFISQPLLDGLWSREAALLEVVRRSLSDRSHRGLEWLVWIDSTSPLVDKRIALEAFLPPSDLEREVQLMYARDIVMIKVSSWSISFLSSVVDRQKYRTEDEFNDPDRWFFEDVTRYDEFREEVVELPTWWFDACRDEQNWGMPSKRDERVRAFWKEHEHARRESQADAVIWTDPRKRLWD